MSLVDPDFEAELTGPEGAKTLAFVKKTLRHLRYVEVTPTGADLAGQVLRGDGEAVAEESDVILRTVPAAATMAVTTGTAVQGDGTGIVYLTTNASGQFEVTVTGTGDVVVEVVVNRGVAILVPLSL